MENFSADRHPSLPPVMPAQKKTPGSSHTDLFERVASEEAHEHAIQKGDVCMMHPTLVMSSSNIDDRRLEMAGGIPYRVADVADGNLTVLVESIPATELPPVKVSREAVIAASQHHIFAHGNRDFRYILYGKPLPTNNSECGLFFESVRLVVHKISDVDGAPRLTMAADIWLTDLFYVEEHQRQPSGQEKKIWTSYTIASYLAPNPLSLAIPKKCTIAPNMWKVTVSKINCVELCPYSSVQVILVCAGGDHEGYDHFSFKSDSPPSIKVFKIDDFIRQFIVTGYEALGGFSEIKPAAACLRVHAAKL